MFVIGKSFHHTLPSELQRCKLGRFFEFLHKMSEIIEPAVQTDLRDGQFGRAQQRCRMPDAKVIDIINHTKTFYLIQNCFQKVLEIFKGLIFCFQGRTASGKLYTGEKMGHILIIPCKFFKK